MSDRKMHVHINSHSPACSYYFSTIFIDYLGQIKKIGVFRVTGLKILGRIGTHIFFNIFFSGFFFYFMHFERHFAFQNA